MAVLLLIPARLRARLRAVLSVFCSVLPPGPATVLQLIPVGERPQGRPPGVLTERLAEDVRQLPDVFGELAHLSAKKAADKGAAAEPRTQALGTNNVLDFIGMIITATLMVLIVNVLITFMDASRASKIHSPRDRNLDWPCRRGGGSEMAHDLEADPGIRGTLNLPREMT
jgi:hypothetical protein